MIGAVVVLYNPSIEEILNINMYKDKVDHVIVIDNSEENHYGLIDKSVSITSNITYYTEQKNLGLARAFNIGVDLLKNKGCDWALLLDADSRLGLDIVSVYKVAIEKHRDKNVAVFSPVHVFERSKNKPYHGYKDVDWSMTSGWLINIEVFVKQKGFLEALFVDGLDMDYCFKSHENGYRIIECGEAIINHHPAETKSFLGFKYGIASPFRYYMQARALIWCWKRYKILNMIGIYFYKWFKVLFLFPDKKSYIEKMISGTREANELFRKL